MKLLPASSVLNISACLENSRKPFINRENTYSQRLLRFRIVHDFHISCWVSCVPLKCVCQFNYHHHHHHQSADAGQFLPVPYILYWAVDRTNGRRTGARLCLVVQGLKFPGFAEGVWSGEGGLTSVQRARRPSPEIATV